MASISKGGSGDGSARHIRGIASKPEDVKLRGEEFTAKVTDEIIGDGIELDRTIEGASTLTIPMSDDSGELRRHDLFQSRFELELDELHFAFVGKEKPDTAQLNVTTEARNVWRLRQHKGDDHGGAAKAYRDKVTRAEFWVNLVKTLKPEIPVFCPELHVVQPIKDDSQAQADAPENDVRRGKGLDSSAKITVKGVAANAEQIRNIDTVLRVGVSLKAPQLALVAAIMAGTQENNCMNSTNDGFFAFTDATVASTGIARSDLAAQAHWAYKVGWHAGLIESINNGLAPGDAAQQMEGSAYPSYYAQWESEARKTVAAFGGGSITTPTKTVTETKRYPFTIAANEDWWTAGQRLFSEVNWRLFETGGLIYVISETELLQSRVRMRCSEGAPGIDTITWNADTGLGVTEITVTGRARDWAAPPGSVAAVEGEGESIDDNYIVSEIRSFLSSPDVEVTLKRPTKPLPEPAPETSTKTIGGGASASATTTDGPEAFQKMVAEVDRIVKLDLPYVFGGGHSTPAPANGPFDCSSFVSRILEVGGVLDTTYATPQLATWGESGKGKLVTVYVHNGGAGGGHTIMKLGDRFAECGGGTNPSGGGPTWFEPSSSYLTEFESIRHPRGL